MSAELREIVSGLLGRPELALRMAAFYEGVDAFVAAQSPVCRNRGVCCRFGEYDHRLYVTAVELAYFVRVHGAAWRSVTEEDVCPYHVAGRCVARAGRPMGCRVFFCDPASEVWQGPAYERYLGELRRIGAALDAEYRYVEWLSALRSLAEGPDIGRIPEISEDGT